MGSAPTPPLAFVEASPGDASLLDEMVAAFHVCENVEMSSDARRRVIAALLANPAQGRVLLFTLPDATICGYAIMAFGFSMEFGGRDAFLDEFFIAEQHRGKGLGQYALVAIGDWARAQGLAAVHLEAEKRNIRARNLYIRLGYEDREHYHLMSLRLADTGARAKKKAAPASRAALSLGRKRP